MTLNPLPLVGFCSPGTCAEVVSVGENVGVLVEKEKLAWSENFSFVVY